MSSRPNQWDWEQGLSCGDCGTSLWEDVERAFAVCRQTYLCRDCATLRGGAFDAETGRWTREPELNGLVDPRALLLDALVSVGNERQATRHACDERSVVATAPRGDHRPPYHHATDMP